MESRPLVLLGVAALLVLSVTGAGARGLEIDSTDDPVWGRQDVEGAEFKSARLETLWIFDAQFNTTTGDDDWTVLDRSGTLGMENEWHKDTIRIGGFPHLGDSAWWCGKYNECWRQPRGYGNNWLMSLERAFPEVAINTNPGDELTLEYDQRFALEHDYDYGYIDVSTDGGDTWVTEHSVNNPGFAGKPGLSKDWDDPETGHDTVDLSIYAGLDVDIRFRVESDGAYSSEDEPDNGAPNHSVQDGAWQIDNIELIGPGGTFWLDDCESPGDNGWVREDTENTGQIGTVWWRGQFGIDFLTGRAFTCDDRPMGTWMFAPVDIVTSAMVDNENTWLMSPPIDISGAPKLVGHWDYWADAPDPTGDRYNLYLASNDIEACVQDPGGFLDEDPGWWFATAGWRTKTDDWDAFAGNAWLSILHVALNDTLDANGEHWGGMFLNFQRLGIPSGDAGTTWEHHTWEGFNDWFVDQLTDALLDTASVKIKDDDGIVSANTVASNDGGLAWSSYPGRKQAPNDPLDHWWYLPPPSAEMTMGSVIRYYFEGMDGVGNIATDPAGAPDRWYEMTILPIVGSELEPGILLVDKHGRRTPGAQRDWRHSSEYYYTEALGILGYEYDKYDVEVPSGSRLSDGPDSVGMKYYDTQIWFNNYFDAHTLNRIDQYNLREWLNQAALPAERNLLVTGNNVGRELIGAGVETLAFYETWLASDWLEDAVGSVTVDSIPGLEDHAGGWDFLTHDDGEAILRGGCPHLSYYDVITPTSGIAGTEIVADYVRLDEVRKNAGVAYTHQTLGYQTVNLGFGIEYMMDGTHGGGSSNYTTEGYYHTGLDDRLNLMQNIMDYFDKAAGGDPTGIVDGGVRNTLSQAYPNPFNPVTKIAYSVREAGRVTIRVFNVSGRTVRTLLEEELAAGATGFVVWDGANDAGERCASGVYFYRIEAPGFASSRKMVMLK